MKLRARAETLLWGAQRASAAVLAVCVLAHLATILYAVRGGLTAAEILSRTRGSFALAFFYGLFVLAVAVHAPVGLRAILRETFGWRGVPLDLGTAAFAGFLVWFGWRAVAGLFA
ncbi:MAG: succinate dehydrogenase [Rhodospirillales bacterium]|nr:succinate dehydrogenase [Rhodospirillales bacterium]